MVEIRIKLEPDHTPKTTAELVEHLRTMICVDDYGMRRLPNYVDDEVFDAAADLIEKLTGSEPPKDNMLLAQKHTGLRVDYTGLLATARRSLGREPGTAEMLRQLEEHLTELGRRWYSGDTAVVDEILQLYCIEIDKRAALAATTEGSSDG